MYNQKLTGWLKHWDFILWDMLCLGVSLLTAFYIRHGFARQFFTEAYVDILVVALILDFTVLICMNTLEGVLKRGYWKEFAATFWNALFLLLWITTYLFALKVGHEYSRITVFLTIGIYLVLTYSVRLCWKHFVKRYNHDKADNALLIMADEDAAAELIEGINSNYERYAIVGLVIHDAQKIGQSVADVPIVSTFDHVIEYVQKHWVDEVLISIPMGEKLPDETIDTLTAMGVTVHINLNQSAKRMGAKQVIGRVGDLQVITTAAHYMTPGQAIAKRTLDIFGGIIGCILTGVVYLFVAPKIKKESPGPVFFTQTRIGKNGKPFKFYKFRSMYLDAEERKAELMDQNRIKDGLMFKIEFDPRIIGNRIDPDGTRHTGIGDFIRRTSLDEFPQFYNVLRGEMSLVGTRPPLVDEYEAYAARHKFRLATKPGITGMWQVSGRSNVMDFEEVVMLDTQYINNWSIGLDLKLLLKTIKVALAQEGSM